VKTVIDLTTYILFSPFNREVANPVRKRIRNIRQFLQFISDNNGVRDCYVSVYSADLILDKVFFDLDGSNALCDAKRMYVVFTEKLGIPVIPVASGKKGIHLYPLFKPKRYDAPKTVLRNAQLYLLTEAFGKGVHPEVTVDPHTIGDVRRICRIPNTLRPPENRSWCTYLPAPDFLDWDDHDLREHIKHPHTYKYDLNRKLVAMDELPQLDPSETFQFKQNGGEIKTEAVDEVGNEDEFLKRVLRPCLYRNIIRRNPPHEVRVATTVDLLTFLPPEKIFKIYEKLGWDDWDPDITRYQIRSCIGLKPYSCRRLRALGIPRECCVG